MSHVVGPNPEGREEGADARRDDVEGPVVFVELEPAVRMR